MRRHSPAQPSQLGKKKKTNLAVVILHIVKWLMLDEGNTATSHIDHNKERIGNAKQ